MPRDRDNEDLVVIETVAPIKLRSDLSNLDEIDIVEFQQVLRGLGRDRVLRRTLEVLQQIADQGDGVDAQKLPAPLVQSGFECQTMALLNGIQAWEGHNSVNGLIPQIPVIRRKAVELRDGESRGGYAMLAVEEVLKEMGALHPKSNWISNPIQAARELFVGHRFIGIANQDVYHNRKVAKVLNEAIQS